MVFFPAFFVEMLNVFVEERSMQCVTFAVNSTTHGIEKRVGKMAGHAVFVVCLLNAIGFVYLEIGLLIGLANMPLTFDRQALMAHFFSAGPSADRPALPRRFGPGSDL